MDKMKNTHTKTINNNYNTTNQNKKTSFIIINKIKQCMVEAGYYF